MKLEKENIIVSEISRDKVLILLNPYSYNPDESFIRACNIVYWLRKNFSNPVFSPILHTHNYDIFCKESDLVNEEDYYKWDLEIYERLKSNSIIIFTKDWKMSKGCKLEMEWVKKNNLECFFIEERL